MRQQKLTVPLAAGGMTGIRQTWAGSAASGLTPVKLASILRACDQGELRAFLILAEEMEERDPHYFSVLGTRKRAISGIMPQVEPASDSARDGQVAEAVREEIAEHPGFADMVEDLLDALGKGFSVVEIDWARSASRWTPARLDHRDPRFFVFDRQTRGELRLPLAAFQKNWRAKPALADWWGRKAMEDPLTGEVVEAQLGSPRRLRTIYDANLRSARAAGQWERIERTKGAFPYLEYTLGASEKHRPHHADKEGLILPVDSPFWDEWMPPNGWGCKCKVRPVTRAEAERRGISATPDIPDRKVVNKRTGDVQLVPVGIDPGWQRNPGKLRRQGAEGLLRDRLEGAPEAVVRAAVKDVATSWAAERVLKGASPAAVPVAVLPGGLAEAAGVKARVVRMTSDYGDKFEARKRRVTTGTLLILSEALQKGSILIERRAGRTDIYIMSAGIDPWVFILKVMAETQEIWVRTIYPLKPAKRKSITTRPGIEVFRE